MINFFIVCDFYVIVLLYFLNKLKAKLLTMTLVWYKSWRKGAEFTRSALMRGREPGFLNRPTLPTRSRREEQESTKKLENTPPDMFSDHFCPPTLTHAAVHTHHGTSPNSGRYCRGKFSKGTPKTFAPLRTSLSFLFSRRFTEIPWRTWRWKRITLPSVTFMVCPWGWLWNVSVSAAPAEDAAHHLHQDHLWSSWCV